MCDRPSLTRSEPPRPLQTSRLALGLACLLSVAGGPGCFKARTPQPPCVVCPQPPDFFEPLTPQIVRDNIQRALEGRTTEPNYRRSLSGPPDEEQTAEFVYEPDPGARAQAPSGYFDGWGKAREVQFMLSVLEGTEAVNLRSVTLDFPSYSEDLTFPSTTNLVRYDVEYDLTLTYSSGDPPVERTERYGGSAKWDLIGGDRNFWTLVRWEDIAPLENPENPFIGTMGTLRALGP